MKKKDKMKDSKDAMDALVESKLKNPERLTVSNAIVEEPSATSWWKRHRSPSPRAI